MTNYQSNLFWFSWKQELALWVCRALWSMHGPRAAPMMKLGTAHYLCRGGEGKICWKDQNFRKAPPADHVNSKWPPILFNIYVVSTLPPHISSHMLYKVIIKMHAYKSWLITLHNKSSNLLYYKISISRRPVSIFLFTSFGQVKCIVCMPILLTHECCFFKLWETW